MYVSRYARARARARARVCVCVCVRVRVRGGGGGGMYLDSRGYTIPDSGSYFAENCVSDELFRFSFSSHLVVCVCVWKLPVSRISSAIAH